MRKSIYLWMLIVAQTDNSPVPRRNRETTIDRKASF